MNINDTIELTVGDIIDIAQLGDVHGSNIIEMYFLGNRNLSSVEILDKKTNGWKTCYAYPWSIDAPTWQHFRVVEVEPV